MLCVLCGLLFVCSCSVSLGPFFLELLYILQVCSLLCLMCFLLCWFVCDSCLFFFVFVYVCLFAFSLKSRSRIIYISRRCVCYVVISLYIHCVFKGGLGCLMWCVLGFLLSFCFLFVCWCVCFSMVVFGI